MGKIRAFFRVDSKYKSLINSYGRIDGILAIICYLIIMVSYYVMGKIYIIKGIYLGYIVNLMLAFFCIFCVLIKKQTMESVGFGKRNLAKSIILGVITAMFIFAFNSINGILNGLQFNSISNLLINLMYYIFIIALVEEIIFRGFIQTRIYGIIKQPILAILLSATMFMSIHIPFQMSLSQMNFITFIFNNYITLIFTFMWHIIFNFMYAKYNSIVAPTIFHGIMNWSNYLFIS